MLITAHQALFAREALSEIRATKANVHQLEAGETSQPWLEGALPT